MQKFINISTLTYLILLILLIGCSNPKQKIEASNESTINNPIQIQDTTIFGISLRLHEKAIELREKAEQEREKLREELEKIKRDGSLSATAKRVLAEAEEAEEKGNKKLALAKIKEYRKIVENESNIINKKLAEAWILEGRTLFSQLKLEEAKNAIEEAIKLNSNNPKYLLTLADYLEWNGKYQKMIETSQKAILIIKNKKPIDKILLAEGLSSIGIGYTNKGNYNLATNPLQKSLEIKKKH